MDSIKYYFERCYPYVIALLLARVIYWLKIDIASDENLNELLNGVVTIDSIIIGFLGALLPIVTSMKTESKFVRYVFEADKKNLLAKYIRETIQFGLLSAGATLVLYLRESITNEQVRKIILFSWIFATITFLVLTYRCMGHMIDLVFGKCVNDKDRNNKNAEKSVEELEFQEKHKRTF